MKPYQCLRKGVILALAAALTVTGCGAAEQDSAAEEISAIAVKAATAQVGTLSISNQFVGTVSPQQQVSIVPLVSGEIDAVYAEVGDEVAAGDVLFHIKDDAARLQKESAQLQKESAQLSAQRTLGSAQTMSNIQMQSNIKSLEYQVKMAQDQYASAVNGAADAREASGKMDDMIREIENGADELQRNYGEMKKAVGMAKQCISWNGLTGWQFQSVYVWPKDPDAYDWNKEDSSSSEEESPTEEESSTEEEPSTEEESGAPVTEAPDTEQGTEGNTPETEPKDTQGTVPAESGSTAGSGSTVETAPENVTEPESAGQTQTPESPAAPESAAASEGAAEPGNAGQTQTQESPAVPESAEQAQPSESAAEPGNAGQTQTQESPAASESAAEPENAGQAQPSESTAAPESAPETQAAEREAAPVSEPRESEAAPASEEQGADAEQAGGVYFSQEKISFGDALGDLTGGTDLAELTPPDVFATKEEAWAAYEAQKGIDEAQKTLAAMGYTAADLGEGRVDDELDVYAEQIASMKTQAATLKSNQASLESSIKSADDAKKSTASAIDFYKDNLNDAVTTYQIQNGEAYQDTADALATQIEAAEVGVKSAEMQLEFYSPKTPISGTVVSKQVELYGMAQPGYAAYVISNQDAMNVTFAVSGQVRESLALGMPVRLEKDGKEYEGTITQIGEAVEAQSGGLFQVKAITEADGNSLVSGTAVKLTIDTFRAENAILLPYDAVHFESEQAYVFVIEDHKAVRTPVTIGLMNEDSVEVTEGLTAGSQVVATWSSQLEDGAEVRIIGEAAE